MIVMIGDRQLLSPQQVCQGCLMSDKSGLPRWQNEKLRCGKVRKPKTSGQVEVYECQMGFNVTWIN